MALIQRETESLNATAELHRLRERVQAARAADLLGFDETPDGERLRRFEITSGRGYSRSIDIFLKLRRAEAAGQMSVDQVTDDPRSDANDMTAAKAEGPLSVVGGPLAVAGRKSAHRARRLKRSRRVKT